MVGGESVAQLERSVKISRPRSCRGASFGTGSRTFADDPKSGKAVVFVFRVAALQSTDAPRSIDSLRLSRADPSPYEQTRTAAFAAWHNIFFDTI